MEKKAVHDGQVSDKMLKTLLLTALALLLISCFVASVLQTAGAKVQLISIKVPTNNAQWVTGTIFRPKTATAKHRVPIVVACPGYLNNQEMQDSTAIELSRRGIAVLVMDPYRHGDSSSSIHNYTNTQAIEGAGMIPLVDYVYGSLNYIDPTRIGITGHSMGAGVVWNVARYYGKQYYDAIAAAKRPDSDGGTTVTQAEQTAANALDRVFAAFPVSTIAASSQKAFSEIHANFGANFAYYDERAYTNKNGDGDLHDAPESMFLVNSALPEKEWVNEVEIGKMYGQYSDRTLRVVYNPKEIHPIQHFSVVSSSYMTDFFTAAFGMENPIPSSNQIWLWKELANFLGVIGIFIIIIPMAGLLLKVPCFAALQHETPACLPALATKKSKAVFYGSIVGSAIVGWLTYIPISNLDAYIFPKITARTGDAVLFNQPITNYIMLWAVFFGIFTLAVFFLTYRFYGRKNGVTPSMWGLKTTPREFLHYLAMAIVIITGVYFIVGLADFIFMTDFRLWSFAFKTFTADKLPLILTYAPFFFIFYLANSISINSANRVSGQKEWKNLLILAIGNILAFVIILTVQYSTLFSTGVTYWKALWQRPLVLIPLVPLLFAATYISRYLFKMTGKVYLGAMVNCLLLVVMSVANTATFSAVI